MQYVILSDFVEEQLRRLRSERDERHQRARLAYQQELRQYDEQLATLSTAYGPAFRRLRFFRGTRTWWQHRKLRKQGDPQPPEPEGPTIEEQRWQGGVEGEQRLRADLTSLLPGSAWTLMKGYQSRRGQIDYLLIGPAGILALKCEHISGTIICANDRWVRQKYDRSGQPVTQVPIVDKAGKSPSQQVNESADHLKEFLTAKGEKCDILKAVILTHPEVRLNGDTSAVPIILLKDIARILWDVCRSAAQALHTDRVVELIKSNHEERDSQTSAGSSPAQNALT